ncbi:DUF1576 domain-containing protein [Aminobacterium mobile]|uniref:DUF1576 domain-containing protein n=1 Tax=Aminobacterium mobile TaxID=81467 RepID=UPI000463F27C|nr:DUF1576 domain-containing protein [Aminobacterium mobile]
MFKIIKKKGPLQPIRYGPYIGLCAFCCLFMIFGVVMSSSPATLLKGVCAIIQDPDYLISDYIGIGGIGAAFFNSGLLTFLMTALLFFFKINITGISISSLLTVSGFALFGKNILNVWPIVLGVYFYSLYQKEHFSRYIYIALFGTALAPLVSHLLFSSLLPLLLRPLASFILGISVGMMLPPLVSAFLRFHQGYNLYNVGFVTGVLGTVYVSILRSYGLLVETRMIWTTGNNKLLGIFFIAIFIIMICTAFTLDRWSKIKWVMAYSGRAVSDFVILEGWGATLMNMGTMGLLATFYILVIGGDLNGPTIGGILTVVGFSAFGKHPRNTIPIILGIALGAITKKWSLAAPPIQLAALFGTTLAPITGEFGWKYGVLAGFIHSSVVLNVGMLHAGFNLYNNGFSGGLVAAVLLPLIEAFAGGDKRS